MTGTQARCAESGVAFSYAGDEVVELVENFFCG